MVGGRGHGLQAPSPVLTGWVNHWPCQFLALALPYSPDRQLGSLPCGDPHDDEQKTAPAAAQWPHGDEDDDYTTLSISTSPGPLIEQALPVAPTLSPDPVIPPDRLSPSASCSPEPLPPPECPLAPDIGLHATRLNFSQLFLALSHSRSLSPGFHQLPCLCPLVVADSCQGLEPKPSTLQQHPVGRDWRLLFHQAQCPEAAGDQYGSRADAGGRSRGGLGPPPGCPGDQN